MIVFWFAAAVAVAVFAVLFGFLLESLLRQDFVVLFENLAVPVAYSFVVVGIYPKVIPPFSL